MKKRYSNWSKWDLHLHTRASNVIKGGSEYFGRQNEFTDTEIVDFLDNIFVDKGPKLITITDHDTFNSNQFLKIKQGTMQKGEDFDESLNCLPGVELDVKFKLYPNGEVVTNENDFDRFDVIDSVRCHIVVIFNDDDFNLDITKYKMFEDIIGSFYIDDTPVLINKIINDFIDNEIEFIIMPHFTKNNSFEDAIKDSIPNNMRKKMKWILSKYFPILDGSKRDFINNAVIEVYANITNNEALVIPAPIVITSDNHDYRNYQHENLTYYKALRTFKGLRMCLTDTPQRLSQEEVIEKPTYISAIEISNIGTNKVIYNNTIQLSDGLNCLIGGRSSGKSLLLKEVINQVAPRRVEAELKNYPRYHNKFKVVLINSRGEQYFGNPEYFSQGDILKKFQNIKKELSLQDDFKEYFPKGINTEEIERKTAYLVNNIESLDLHMKLLSETKNKVKNINIYDYLYIGKLELSASFSNHSMRKHVDYASELENNLKNYLSILNDSTKYILHFKTLLEKHNELINDTIQILKKSSTKLQSYRKILKATDKFIQTINSKFSNKVKRNKELNLALNKISNDVKQYSQSIKKSESTIKEIVETIPNIAKNNVIENQIGRHRFMIRVNNDLTVDDLLQSYREYYKKFNYIIDDKLEKILEWHKEHQYENNKTKNLNIISRRKIDEKLKIMYLIYEDDELINEMSEGRKVGVFLDLVLNRRGSIEPLIIDQPEDDMDNEDIYKVLVSTLRKVKNTRQVIIASHDANVVVNGDSENIIFCEKKGKLRINYKFGALEYSDKNINMQNKVCSVLEGGEHAFIKRSEKYDINKIKLSNWGN